MSSQKNRYQQQRKYVVDEIAAQLRRARTTRVITSAVNGGSGSGALTVHDLGGQFHSGNLPWARVTKTGSSLTHLESRAHALTTNLTNDDHSQYVHNTIARTITAAHVFNRAGGGAPFAIGVNSNLRLVAGLNSDQVDGYHETTFMRKDANSDLDMNGYHITSDDGDTYHLLGRAFVGYAGHGDWAGFGHRDVRTTTGYGFLQNSAGQTIVNAPAGQEVYIRNENGTLETVGATIHKMYDGIDLQSDHYASQTTGWRNTYEGAGDYRYLYADEMHVKAFIADLEQALAGGQIICYSVAELGEDFTIPDYGATAALTVKSFPGFPNAYVFRTGDTLAIRIFNRTAGTATVGGELEVSFAFGTLSAPSINPSTQKQSWTFTRLSSSLVNGSPAGGYATGGLVVNAGAICLDFGVSGNGYYEVSAVDGLLGVNSPYAQVVTWGAHPWYDRTVRVRMGNLYGLGFSEYGLYAQGLTNEQYIKASDAGIVLRNADFSMYDGATQTVDWDHTDGSLLIGLNVGNSNDAMLRFNGSTGDLRVGQFGAGKANLLYTGGTFHLRQNATNVITLDSSGDSYFSGVMTIGTAGEIRQGTGTLGSDFAGLRVRRISNIGRVSLYSGDNEDVILDNLGIDLAADTGDALTPSRHVAWWLDTSSRTGSPVGRIFNYNDGAVYFAQHTIVDAKGSATRTTAGSWLRAESYSGASTGYWIVFSSGGIATNCEFTLTPNAPTLGSNWAQRSGENLSARYFANMVEIVGIIDGSSTPSTTLATVAAAYRPAKRRFGIVSVVNGATINMRRVDIETDGTITAQNWTPASGDAVLFGISYFL